MAKFCQKSSAYRAHRLSIIQLDENAKKKISKRFAKVTSKKTHWEWIVGERLSHANFKKIASQSRLRWKEEDMFNDLQHRGKAIARTTPILMALYTLVCLIGHRLNEEAPLSSEKTAWCVKEKVTFSDLLKAVRVDLWKDNLFSRKEFSDPSIKIQLESEELRGQLRDFVVELLMQAA